MPSLGFDNVFPPDGNNYYAQKVDQASAGGVLFVTAAGNEAGKYWSGSWRDTNGNGFLEFGGTEMLPIAAAAPGSGVVLRWDDPFGASTHDYDMLVVTGDFASNPVLSRDNPAIVAASVDLQNGTDNPREIAEFELSEDQQLYVVVFRDPSSPASGSQRFWIWAADGIGAGYAVPAGSLTLPGDARGALTVGAVGWSSGAVEPFSSRGPTNRRTSAEAENFYLVNSVFPRVLADACAAAGARLIHISTDCVFDGRDGPYTEQAETTATDLYGRSKSLGEPANALVIRTSIIGPESQHLYSLLAWFLAQSGSCRGYVNHHWNGMSTLQLSRVVDQIIRSDLYCQGVRHVFSNDVSKYELLVLIREAYQRDIVIAPLEELVRFDLNFKVEVAVGAAVLTRLAFTRQANLRPAIHPRWDRHHFARHAALKGAPAAGVAG